ncbi:MAG: RHS repeat-associated core domain-containing protein, partial [Candidatus Omnitrophota bacterium]|nr:RHS repeat-associated core domain-containing protein [Candidatus Omnitrophota bacterium]
MKIFPKRKDFLLLTLVLLLSFISSSVFANCKSCNNIRPIDTTQVDAQNNSDGDPVNLRTGNQFLGYTDFSIPARGLPLELSRTYSSRIPFSLRGWFWESGQWQVEQGVYDGQGGRIITNTTWNDFTLTLFMKTISSDQTHPWEAAYVDFRYQDLNNYYYFLIDLNGQIELTKYKDGVQSFLVQKPSAYSAFNNNKIEIQAQGSQIYIYVNDNLEISYNDPNPLYSGKVALDTTQYNHSQFSNVSVSGSNSSLVDDFSGDNWTPVSGIWRVEDLKYSGQNGMTATNLNWTDTIIEADIFTKSRGANPWDVAYVKFRYADPQNHYYFLIHTNGILELSKQKNGMWSQLTTKASTYNPLNWNHIKIENTGANIKVYIGQTLEIDYTDLDPLIQGKVSLDAQASHAYYKNVTITGTSSWKDTFDSDSGEWEPQSGTWALELGEYSGESGLSLLKGILTDFVFTTDFKTVTPGQNPWDVAFLNFRYTDNQNNYYFLIKTDGTLELTRWKNGIWSQLVTKPSTYNPLIFNNVKIEAQGSSIKIYVNSTLEINYTDLDPLTQGRIGLAPYYCHAHFDNVTVTKSSSITNGFKSNTDWSEISGTWKIENKEYSGTQGLSLSQISSWDDFTFDVDMKTITAGPNPWDVAFLTFRYTNSQNHYYFLIKTDGTLELSKWKNGIQYWLVGKPSVYSPLNWNHVKVDTQAGNIKIYVNSILEIDYTDLDPLLQGKIGLAPYYCHAHFDNVNVQDKNQTQGDTSGEWVGVFGRNWQSNIEIRLVEDSTIGDVAVYKEEGIKEVHTKNADNTYTPPKGIYETLTKSPSGFTLKEKFGKTHTFNLQGKLTSITDRNSNSITITYNAQGKPITITDASGRAISLAYNAQGFVSQATDPAGRIISYAYDLAGHLISVTDPRGNATTYTYDLTTHNMTSVTDKNAHTLTYGYYYNDQVKSQTDALGNTTVYTYDFDHTYVTNARNDTYVYTFDTNNNLISVQDPYLYVESYAYDTNRNRTSKTDKNGNSTSYTYDSKGNVLTQTDAQGNITTYTYEPNYNQVTSLTDAKGRITTYEYDANGNLIKITDPQLNITTFTYDQYGQLLTKTDALNNATTYAYDTYGNLTSITDPLGNVTIYTYNLIGRRLTVTDARNNTTAFTYDANGNVTQVTDALNNTTTFTYDKENNLLTTTDAQGSITTNQYDSMDNLIKVTDAQNNITQYTYDLVDYMLLGTRLKTSVIDTKLNTTIYTYDKLGRLIQTKDALLQITSYTYDNVGNLLSITDAKGNVTTYTYDTLNRLIKTTFPDTSFETYSYDQVGSMTQKVMRKGDAINFTYDSLNRLIKKTYPDLSNVTYTYDSLSRLMTVIASPSGEAISHTYDALGRLISVTYPNTMVVSYQYDQVGNRTKLTYPDTSYLTYTYDALNRLTQIKDQALATISTFTYDNLSRRTNLTLANGVTTSYSYDSLSRLLSLINQKPPTTISSFGYTYDQIGNRLSMTTQQGNYNYTYDNIYQLAQVQKPDLTTKTYNFDLVGNRTTVINGGTETYASNILNQYTSINTLNLTYDLNGNLTQKTQGIQSTQYTYDYENRLKTVIASPSGEAIYFKYDAFGRRISKEVNGVIQAKYLYDQDNIILDLDQNNQITAKYIYGPAIDEPLVMIKGSGVYYYSVDGLGSTVNLTDNTGTVAESYTYDEYGNVSAPSQVGNRYLYTGREYDPEVNLYYYRARYYDPSIGRFLQTDPIGYRGGINLYGYVGNKPINYIDTLGLRAKEISDKLIE